MKIAIILNGISRKKKKFYTQILPPLQQAFDITVFETQRAGHASTLASEAANKKFDLILAAGGDGTLNQVVNGIFSGGEAGEHLPVIGIIPLGTGNDFAKMCGVKASGHQIASLIQQSSFKFTDVGKIECSDESGNSIVRYFINVASIGMGPEVVHRLSKSDRSLGPTLTYLKAITATFFTHKPQPVLVETDLWQWQGMARVVAIANGKSFGNSIYIAPDALAEDGKLSSFIAGNLSLIKFVLALQALKGGKKLKDKKIHYAEGVSFRLSSSQMTPIEAEGELQGILPASISVLPSRIRVLR